MASFGVADVGVLMEDEGVKMRFKGRVKYLFQLKDFIVTYGSMHLFKSEIMISLYQLLLNLL